MTTTYKKASKEIVYNINQEEKAIATQLDIKDRTERTSERQALISLKDHIENFANNPTCRLINPAKSEIGRISKHILQRINTDVRNKTPLNQWKKILLRNRPVQKYFRQASIHLYRIRHRKLLPSISEELLTSAFHFAKKHTKITNQEIDIIMHSRKSILLHNGSP